MLEIEEGCKYNNLINEIEDDFDKNYSKAQDSKLLNQHEKTIKYLDKCLKIDPDNNKSKRIINELKYYINRYVKRLYELAINSYYDNNYVLSQFYLTKSYCLFIEYNEYLYRCNILLDIELFKLEKKINLYLDKQTITDINENMIEKIIF
jgi:tetratricopeptide (TPR) repeat protein